MGNKSEAEGSEALDFLFFFFCVQYFILKHWMSLSLQEG